MVAVAPPGEPCAVVVVDPFAVVVVVVVEVLVLAVGGGAGGGAFSVDLHPVKIEQVIMLPIAYDISTNLFVFIRLVLSLDLAAAAVHRSLLAAYCSARIGFCAMGHWCNSWSLIPPV